MKLKVYLVFLLVLFFLSLDAQISQTEEARIDSIFTSWEKGDHPGGAIGVLKEGKIIYSKAFGKASLEYDIENKTETIFNTGSVSKQFTAMGIVRLHEKGLLTFDDDIRKHLPDLPDFGHTITIRHMLHHTSGMRSLHAMLGLAGWRSDDSRTNEDLYRFMLKQKDLNFVPGSEYLYCNTGYMLMVNIIEKVTGESFPEWMRQNIFEPLGMQNTYVEDRYDRVVKNNATSYYDRSKGFFRAVEYWGYVGSGNMHSSITDLLLYLQNFSTPKAGWEKSFELMKTKDLFNNGELNNYAFGVNVNESLGYEKIYHGGAIGGFRAHVSTYPSEELSIAVLTNFSSSNPGGIEKQIAKLLLTDQSKAISSIDDPSMSEVLNYDLSQLTGKYEIEAGIIFEFTVENDSLHANQLWDNKEYKVFKKNGNTFLLSESEDNVRFIFSNLEGGKTQVLTFYQNGSPLEAMRVIEKDLSSVQREEFLGRFYSPELESTFDILMENEDLIAHHARHGDLPIDIVDVDKFEIVGFASLEFVRNGKNLIIGMKVSNGRARNVWFERRSN